MGASDLELALKLQAAVSGLDQVRGLVAEIESFGGSAGEVGEEAHRLGQRLDELTQQNAAIAQVKRLGEQSEASAKALAEAQDKAQRLGRQFAETEAPSKRLTSQFNKSREAVRRLTEQHQQHELAVQKARQEMVATGVTTQNLELAERRVGKALNEVSAEFSRQRDALSDIKTAASAAADAREAAARAALEAEQAATVEAQRAAKAAQDQAEAWHRLGLATKSELGAAADQARSDFATIEASGEATYQQLESAARLAMEKIAAAHGGVVPEADRARFAVYKQAEAADQVGDAFRRAGLQTREALERTAEEAKRDFFLIQQSGVATHEVLTEAAQRYARAAKAAYGDAVSASERARLQALGVDKAFWKAGESGEEAFSKAKASAMDLADVVQLVAGGLLVQQFVEANRATERMQKALEEVLGTSEAAAAEVSWLADEAERLGLRLPDAADAYTQLAAAAKGTALAGGESRRIFVAVAQAMAKLGKSADDTQGALLAVSQMISKGNVSAEELRGQLGERLPGAFQLAAKAIGTTTAGLGKMLENGEVVAEEFLPKFAAALADAYGGGEEAIESFSASQNRFLNAWDDVLRAVGDAGAWEVATRGMDVATDAMQHLGVAAALVTAGFVATGEAIGTLVAAIATMDFSEFGDEIERIFERASQRATDTAEKMYGLGEAGEAAGAGIEAGAKAAGDAVTEGLTGSAKAAAKEFDNLVGKGKGVGDALTKALEKIDLSGADGVQALAGLLGEVESKGNAAAKELRDGVAGALKKLNDDELAEFQVSAQEAFDGAEDGAERLGVAIEAALREAFRRLGLDLEETRTGIDTVTATATKMLNTVADNAQATSQDWQSAWYKALATVDNPSELKSLEAALERAKEKGKVSAETLEKHLEELRLKTKEVATAADKDLADAFARAGIKSKAELEAIAAKAEADYRRIKQSGEATAEGLVKAAERWMEAEVTAGNTVGAIRAEAAVKLQAMGKAAKKASTDTTGAMKEIRSESEKTKDALEGIQHAISTADSISELQALADELRKLRAEGKITAEELESGLDGIRGRAQSVGATLASIAKATDAMFRNLSTTLRDTYYGVESVDGELAQLAAQAQATIDAFWIPDISRDSWSELARHQRDLIIQFRDQASAAARLHEELQGVEGANDRVAAKARRAIREFDLLDQSQLDGLMGEIERVEAASDRLADTVTSTVDRLRDELSRLEGDQAAIEKRRYEERRKALEEQADQARKASNEEAAQEANEGLDLLDEIHRRRMDEIREAQREAAERTERDEERPAPERAPEPVPVPTPAGAGEIRVLRLEAGGAAVELMTDEDLEAITRRVIRVIEEAGMRVAG